jgi:hypothetical protein
MWILQTKQVLWIGTVLNADQDPNFYYDADTDPDPTCGSCASFKYVGKSYFLKLTFIARQSTQVYTFRQRRRLIGATETIRIRQNDADATWIRIGTPRMPSLIRIRHNEADTTWIRIGTL